MLMLLVVFVKHYHRCWDTMEKLTAQPAEPAGSATAPDAAANQQPHAPTEAAAEPQAEEAQPSKKRAPM